MKLPFLTADWRNLIVVNFKVSPDRLKHLLPEGTELDFFEGEAFLSLVGFYFARNKLFGLLPTYPAFSFEEINLRFYVRRQVNGEIRRGVTFIKEIVPSELISRVANYAYNEPYVVRKTFQETSGFDNDRGGRLSYGLMEGDARLEISAHTTGVLRKVSEDPFGAYILERNWGYTTQLDGSTVEYRVSHPSWDFWAGHGFEMTRNLPSIYGSFSEILEAGPHSVLITRGSRVSVAPPKRLNRLSGARANEPMGWVLYDGSCGFCSWWIPFWRSTIQKAGYDIAPVQSQWVRQKLVLSEVELSNDIRLLLRNGTLINGADAYLFGMQRVWWSRPFGYLFGMPGFRWLTWKFYRAFNRNRFLVSKICRLPPRSGL